jgi:G3E family GTPase
VSRTPVFLLSGFLGSGKTTLLNALLRQPAFAGTAVVVNEFGEIGLDHLMLAQASDTVKLLEGGCLCCTVVDSLHDTLAALHAQRARGDVPRFDRMIIETTGLADPGPIVSTLLGNPLVTDHYRFEVLVVAVDVQHATETIDVHPEVARQAALADRIVLTKLDVAAIPPEFAARLDALNSTAERFDGRDHTALARAFACGGRQRVMVPAMKARPKLVSTGGAMHGSGLQSHAFVLSAPTSWAGIAAWWRVATDRFGDRLLRSKGIVELADNGDVVFLQTVRRVFHQPERLPGWPDHDHRSRLVCITQNVERAELAATLLAFDVAPGTAPQ